MALELTNRPLGGKYTILESRESISNHRVFAARDSTGYPVAICSVNREELAGFTPLVGASQHPNVLPLLDKLDDQGLLGLVCPDVFQQGSAVVPNEDLYSAIEQICDALTWLYQRGFVPQSFGPRSVRVLNDAPVICDYFLSSYRDEEDESSLNGTVNHGEQHLVYLASTWALRAAKEPNAIDEELREVLTVGSSFMETDRWQTLEQFLTEVRSAQKNRNKVVLSSKTILYFIAIYCFAALVLMRELAWQLISDQL